MASRRDGIIAQVVSALNTVSGKPSGLTVDRFRNKPIDKVGLKQISVYPMGETCQRAGHPVYGTPKEYRLTVRLEIRTVGTASVTGDAALDPLYVWAIQKLEADRTLGGRADSLQEVGVAWDGEASDQEYVRCWLDIEVRYVANAEDPSLYQFVET